MSKKAVCESQASCNVSLCGLREMRETKKKYLRKGERGSSCYNITSVGTRIANKFGRSGVSNKLDIARERCTLNSGC